METNAINAKKQYLIQLSKVISHALRHGPWLYELELDDEGWIPIDELISALQEFNEAWKDLNKQDLIEMIKQSDKKRHEIHGEKIRALYGHSIPRKLKKEPAEPPELLYHGTSPETIPEIEKYGLKPMGRQYVHLSTDIETAKQVGKRKSPNPIILTVRAKDAFQHHIHFYLGNELVWLADEIPIDFIKKNDN